RPAAEADMPRDAQVPSAVVPDQPFARAAARLIAADPTVAALARQVQGAQRKRDAARLELAVETAKPDDQRGAAREAALIRVVQNEGAASEQLLQQLQAVFPGYSKFANPGGVDLDVVR